MTCRTRGRQLSTLRWPPVLTTLTKYRLWIRNAWQFSLLPFLVTQVWPQAISGLCTFPLMWDMTLKKGPSWHRGTWILNLENLTLGQWSLQWKFSKSHIVLSFTSQWTESNLPILPAMEAGKCSPLFWLAMCPAENWDAKTKEKGWSGY